MTSDGIQSVQSVQSVRISKILFAADSNVCGFFRAYRTDFSGEITDSPPNHRNPAKSRGLVSTNYERIEHNDASNGHPESTRPETRGRTAGVDDKETGC